MNLDQIRRIGLLAYALAAAGLAGLFFASTRALVKARRAENDARLTDKSHRAAWQENSGIEQSLSVGRIVVKPEACSCWTWARLEKSGMVKAGKDHHPECVFAKLGKLLRNGKVRRAKK